MLCNTEIQLLKPQVLYMFLMICLFDTVSRPALGPTQPLTQLVRGGVFAWR